jgi:hypothetical protein
VKSSESFTLAWKALTGGMNCNPEGLSHYLDGELSPDEVEQLRTHLSECDRCSAALAAYRELDDDLAHLNSDHPPRDLRRALYQQIDQRRRTRAHWGWTAPLLTPAVPLALAVVLVAVTLVIGRSTQVGAPPVMTAAFAVQEMPDSLDGLRLELVFDRAVAADSFVNAITVVPALALTERVHDNRVELLPGGNLLIGGAYRLIVANVSDRYGNVQTQPVLLTLSAGPIATVVQESAPSDLTAASLTPRQVRQPTDRPASMPPTGATDGLNSGGGGSPADVFVGSSIIGGSPIAGSVPGGSLAALAPRRGESGPLPAPMPVLAVDGPIVTETSGVPGLAAILEGAPGLQARFGAPTAAERVVEFSEQTFQGGAMLARADQSLIYVLVRSTGRWSSAPNTFRRGDVLAPVGERPPGTFEPLGGFGKIWREQPAVKLQLGWPVYDERRAPCSLQSFEHGLLLRSSYGVIYALLNDGTWQVLTEPRR